MHCVNVAVQSGYITYVCYSASVIHIITLVFIILFISLQSQGAEVALLQEEITYLLVENHKRT